MPSSLGSLEKRYAQTNGCLAEHNFRACETLPARKRVADHHALESAASKRLLNFLVCLVLAKRVNRPNSGGNPTN